MNFTDSHISSNLYIHYSSSLRHIEKDLQELHHNYIARLTHELSLYQSSYRVYIDGSDSKDG